MKSLLMHRHVWKATDTRHIGFSNLANELFNFNNKFNLTKHGLPLNRKAIPVMPTYETDPIDTAFNYNYFSL